MLAETSRGEQLIKDLKGKAPFTQSTDEITELTRVDEFILETAIEDSNVSEDETRST